MKNRLDKLLSIKSLVTLAMTAVFCTLALRQSISGQDAPEIMEGIRYIIHKIQIIPEDDNMLLLSLILSYI